MINLANSLEIQEKWVEKYQEYKADTPFFSVDLDIDEQRVLLPFYHFQDPLSIAQQFVTKFNIESHLDVIKNHLETTAVS
jgi:hypothetical protein